MLAIYCRTSKNKEVDYSIETQQQGGLKLSLELGKDYKYYVDEGKSGTLDMENRTAFGEMMADIKRGKITAIYCIDQSRIERNTDIWRFFAGECINNKCKFYPNGREFDLEEPENMLIANLLSVVNSFYAQITSKKVKLANYNKAKKGKTHGMKAYGLMKDHDNNYAILEEEAVHIRRMYQFSLQGIGGYTIANIFNDEGIPTKYNKIGGIFSRKDEYTDKETVYEKSAVKWRGNVIVDMLHNPIYKGIRRWKDLEVNIPAIVSEELWQEVNDNLSKNKKKAGKKTIYKYLLNGLITCGHCDNNVLGKKRIKGNDNAYKCKGKRPPHKDCSESRGISLPKLETFIVHHLFYNKQLKELLTEAPKNDTEALRLKKNLTEKQAAQEKMKKRIERLAELLKDPELTDDESFKQDYKQSKTKQQENKKEIEELVKRIAEVESGDMNKRTKTLIESYTANAGFETVKRLVHSIVEKIELIHYKEKKAGYFVIKVFYKHHGEYSVFTTNWKAMDWIWLSHHREEAANNEELKQERELSVYMIQRAGKRPEDYKDYLDNFKGNRANAQMMFKISLSDYDLIRFDYTT